MNKLSTILCRTVQYLIVQFSHLVITESSRSRFIYCLVANSSFSRYGVVSVVTSDERSTNEQVERAAARGLRRSVSLLEQKDGNHQRDTLGK